MSRIDLPASEEPSANAQEATPGARLLQMITASWVSQSLYAVAKLQVADELARGPLPASVVAARVGVDGDALHRLLRALASVGVFTEVEGGAFALTPLGELLRAGVPGSLRALAVMCGEEYFRAWAEVLYSLRTGQTAWEMLFGAPVFPYLAAHPEAAATYHQAMTGFATLAHTAVAAAYDFAGVRTVCDVGGGHGTLLASVLEARPGLRGILFDQAPVVEGAREALTRRGLAERCDFVAGDFFERVPEGADAYLLSTILHEWDDARAARILTNIRRAMAPGGRVLVVEMVLPPGDAPSFGKLLDVSMLVCTGGRERTAEAYRALFASAGFRLARIVPTRSPVSVVEGREDRLE